MDIYEALSKRIKEKRLQLGLSQAKLSERCNRGMAYIGLIERGERHPTVAMLVKIANALNVNADYLLGDSIEYDNSKYVGKAYEILNDMDEKEIEYAYDFLNNFRDFQGKKPID